MSALLVLATTTVAAILYRAHGQEAAALVCAAPLVQRLHEREPIAAASIVIVHRNGEPDPCGLAHLNRKSMQNVLQAMLEPDEEAREACVLAQASTIVTAEPDLSKYQLETFLTDWLGQQLVPDQCGESDKADNKASSKLPGLLEYCDMGPARTVIRPDHDDLVRTKLDSLPCRFYTRTGHRVRDMADLQLLLQRAVYYDNGEAMRCAHNANDATCSASGPQLHLYAVPAGRVFMFAPSYVGETFELGHVAGAHGEPITLTTLSLQPRVFDITNFYSPAEAQELIDKAVAETSETHGLHRSTTGAIGGSVFNKRTSENAWDTTGSLAMAIKRRCFATLGLDEYHESHADGLQILRYNATTAYVPHMDYLEDSRDESPYDFDSAGKGGNRFATILLYMSDLPENAGGETVFPRAYPDDANKVDVEDAIADFRASEQAHYLKPGSWEEKMTAECRTRLAVTPRKSRAVLFYSQYPDGRQDATSLHGGCPVLSNVSKWAANLWVWNAPRPEYPGRPLKRPDTNDEGLVPSVHEFQQINAVFRNSGGDERFADVDLYYSASTHFGKLRPDGTEIRVNTYQGHEWHVRAGDETLASFVIGPELTQEFTV